MITMNVSDLFRMSFGKIFLVGTVSAPLETRYPVPCELFINGEKKQDIVLTGARMPGRLRPIDVKTVETSDLAAFDGVDAAQDRIVLYI